MNAFRFILGLGVTLVAISSFAQRVQTDHDPSVNFLRYITYSWKDQSQRLDDDSPPYSPHLDDLVKDAVNREFWRMAYAEVPSGEADFLIAYYVATKDRSKVDAIGLPRVGEWTNNIRVERYQEGTFVVDLIDPRSGRLIWRGIAAGLIDNSKKMRKTVRRAVKKMFKKFPPQLKN